MMAAHNYYSTKNIPIDITLNQKFKVENDSVTFWLENECDIDNKEISTPIRDTQFLSGFIFDYILKFSLIFRGRISTSSRGTRWSNSFRY